MKKIIELTVNGRLHELAVAQNRRLVDLLREELGLTGTKEGCGQGECGSCTVLLDGKPVNACLVLALQAEGRRITTIEGLERDGVLHPLQRAFVEKGAVQCGYCTPGMLLSAKALLDRIPQPTDGEIRKALSGNLCRCTGYQKIIDSVHEAADSLNPIGGSKAE